MEKTWIEKAIEREATPKAARTQTVSQFAQENGIDESTYYYQMRKKENMEEVLRICLSNARTGAPEVLEKLRQKAEEGTSDKAIEMYLKFILELAEKTDITSKGEKIMFLPSEVMERNAIPHRPGDDNKG